jgi:hypothetical protein
MKPSASARSRPIRSRSSHGEPQRLSLVATKPETAQRDEDYRVGPGRPPKEHQFKPGQSGNPKGKRKGTLLPDLKALLEHALNEKTKFKRDEQQTIMTKAAAGIQKLVNGFAEGDRYARRDLILLADKLGVDLTAGQLEVIEQALAPPGTPDDQALVDDYVRRRWLELSNVENDPQRIGSESDASQDEVEQEAAR